MRPTGVMPVPSIPWHIAHFAKNSCRPACKFPAEACNGFVSRRERIGIAKFRTLRATALSRCEGSLVARNPRRTSNTKQSAPVITKIAKTSSIFLAALMSRCHEILHLGLHRVTLKSWELVPPAAGRSVASRLNAGCVNGRMPELGGAAIFSENLGQGHAPKRTPPTNL